ncbi:hypothetical protein [Nocardia terpenica]|uniref:Uncharacterized protein n=1 Tax=Nocardia terpenica TaxID=455432 RepID=A0A164HWA7_9NOCA|nr:hypothetical protein [Nocardia terpenica]KZM68872.1 hypothetical protein AWN90_13880 [Nocardia terpenica]NQE88082.1 hypothetical protein [Nocardia terpenica]
MAESDYLTTVYVDVTGLTRECISERVNALVAEKYAATAEISERAHHDSGNEIRARLHTRAEHVNEIRRRFNNLGGMIRDYPLQCAPDYAAQVLAGTERSLE